MKSKILNNLTFKTTSYRKNYDFINDNDSIITEHEGEILKLKILEHKTPELIGEYSFSIWNIKLTNELKISINELIDKYNFEDSYNELKNSINNQLIDLNKYHKLLIIHSIILKEEYRKLGVVEEFIEMIYRDYYNENTLILGLVKPIQYNKIDYLFYLNHKTIQENKTLNKFNQKKVSAFSYYNLSKFDNNLDFEKSTYKLFSVANRCDFKRIDDSYLFKFIPQNTPKRLFKKRKFETNYE